MHLLLQVSCQIHGQWVEACWGPIASGNAIWNLYSICRYQENNDKNLHLYVNLTLHEVEFTCISTTRWCSVEATIFSTVGYLFKWLPNQHYSCWYDNSSDMAFQVKYIYFWTANEVLETIRMKFQSDMYEYFIQFNE